MTVENESGYQVRVDSYGGRVIAKVKVCEVCGEYRGEMFYPNTGETSPITCLCDGWLCPKCGKNRLHRRGSEIMDKQGNIWHVPWFAGSSGCKDCARKAGVKVDGPDGPPPTKEQIDCWNKFIDQCFNRDSFTGGPYDEG